MEAQQKSQVWWSFPGGIGWPTAIPLKGGKRKTRKSKSRKGSRKGRKGSTRRR